jgi:hypothetical protein
MGKKVKGGSVEQDGPTGLERGTGDGMEVWIRSGVYGELTAVRKSAATHPDSDLESLAESIGHAVIGVDSNGAAVGAAINDVIPQEMRGDVDVRFLVTDSMPTPSMLLGQLVPVYQWPSLVFAPTGIRVGAAYLTDVDGNHVVAVVAKRHVQTRAKRAA